MLEVTFGVLACIRDSRERVLLVKTTYGRNHWQLPGGYVEEHESPVAALRRELREELQMEIEVGPLAGTYYKVYERNLSLVFFCSVMRGRLKPNNGEISEAAFFQAASLPDGLSARGRIIVNDCIRRERSPYLWVFSAPGTLVSP